MGKRKSKARVMTKAKPKVDTVFDCPFCNHSRSVECTIDRRIMKARVKCRVCDATHESDEVTHLTDPIDVYCDWIDLCEELNKRALQGQGSGAAAAMGIAPAGGSGAAGGAGLWGRDSDLDEDLEDFVVNEPDSDDETGPGAQQQQPRVKQDVKSEQEDKKRKQKLRRVKSEDSDAEELQQELDDLREEEDEGSQDF